MLNIKRVVVAVSGGVDSAVAAMFLKKKGYDVIGAFMENWDITNEIGTCSAIKDAEDSQRVCKKLGIDFHHINFVKEYWNSVFSNLIHDYQNGCTPNPDILCNQQIKFDKFYNYAREKMGADAIATGHYASTSFGSYLHDYNVETGVHLLKSGDSFKDQTFFLSQVSQQPLQRTMFPVGNLKKADVKSIASQSGMDYLINKKESRGICFIGSRNFQNFISEYVADSPGYFRDIDTGVVVGEHAGIHLWTVGQRCRIGGQPKPYFVARKNSKTNEILVALGTDHPSLYSNLIFTSAPHWIHSIPHDLEHNGLLECEFRFQHTKALVMCQVVQSSDSNLLVRLACSLRALTPGQYAVFYKSNECLGSARITQLGPSLQSLSLRADKLEGMLYS